MAAPTTGGVPASYFARLYGMLLPVKQLLGPPSDPRSGEARQRLLRQAFVMIAVGAVAVAALMVWVDVPEIKLMPRRGSPSLWPVRILTDFGKAGFVLWAIAGLLIVAALAAPAVRQGWRSRLRRMVSELQYLLLAVLVPILVGELIKWIVGRGRPFVGGEANAFNFSHFSGTSAYASFPSAHAITSAALAFAVAALWPRLRLPMIVYALMIIATRLVLLAHHPSDVVAGALFGVLGAMAVRCWFAGRRLLFAVGHDGAILPPARAP
jgi:undecaprenyl-diphosphatase